MSDLQPSPQEFKQMMDRLSEFGAEVLASDGRASDLENIDVAVAAAFEAEPIPADLEDLLTTLTIAAAKGMNHLHPGFLAYIPIAGTPISAAADYLAALLNRYVGVQWASPVMAQIEWSALRWMADLFGYPKDARGVFTSGGSIANFTALVTARHAKLGNSHEQGRVYVTDQSHHSIERSARMAGLAPDCIRVVPTTEALRMAVPALAAMIDEDSAAGKRPFLVIANAGTTNTGAVDPIQSIVDFSHPRGLWVHVDGAYGGAFILTEHGRNLFEGIDQADSITIDPHKGLFFSMGMGCVLVRDGSAMRAAHLGTADYLLESTADGDLPNFSDYSIELTRPFRGLRLWMAVKLYGWEPFRVALDRNRSLALGLFEALRAIEGLETPWVPDLSTVAFRIGEPAQDGQNLNLVNEINSGGKVL
ncbi:MAG: aminotransferase class V-fold PLP-dependent enzyme, partial [Actinobacteria bacterium]|nr:aminotransferase class V-fold PLP-dependent enzyme [Actinomycetota bacterium]